MTPFTVSPNGNNLQNYTPIIPQPVCYHLYGQETKYFHCHKDSSCCFLQSHYFFPLTVCNLLALNFFTQHNSLEILPDVSSIVHFFFIAEWYSKVWISHCLFNHLSIEGQLKSYYKHSCTVCVCVCVCVKIILNSYGVKPRSVPSGLYGNYIFRFLRNCPAVFQSGCTIS